MGALLELTDINKSFHENRVLKSVNISFMTGEDHRWNLSPRLG
jgi:ABC-type sugar transport system ATPase subunit